MHGCDIKDTDRILVIILDSPGHELPRQSLETDDLIGGAQGVTERNVEGDISGVDRGMWNTEDWK